MLVGRPRQFGLCGRSRRRGEGDRIWAL